MSAILSSLLHYFLPFIGGALSGWIASEYAKIKSEYAKIKADVAIIKQDILDEIAKLRADIKL